MGGGTMASMQMRRRSGTVQCAPWRCCWRIFLLMLLCWCSLSDGVAATRKVPWVGTVTHVTDGDTLWVQARQGGEPRKIRLTGIDAPEICQVYGETARKALASRVLGQVVLVQPQHKDDYGRLLARITVQERDVGHWMVRNGHAWSYRGQRSAGPYAQQEAWARSQALGLWQMRAMSPSIFRRRHGSCH